MGRLIYLSLLLLVISSCHSDLENKYYEALPGLWQQKGHKDSLYTWPGCSEFFSNGTWMGHHGCTIAEGIYWFDEDTLFTTVYNYTNYEEFDTAKAVILELDTEKMTTYNLQYDDTIYYRKIEKGDSSSCWSFDY
ncbi:MAG: hypothetical protein ACI8ZM_001372 [Crocinitomix sp.]|jgi:hypothetical protein